MERNKQFFRGNPKNRPTNGNQDRDRGGFNKNQMEKNQSQKQFNQKRNFDKQGQRQDADDAEVAAEDQKQENQNQKNPNGQQNQNPENSNPLKGKLGKGFSEKRDYKTEEDVIITLLNITNVDKSNASKFLSNYNGSGLNVIVGPFSRTFYRQASSQNLNFFPTTQRKLLHYLQVLDENYDNSTNTLSASDIDPVAFIRFFSEKPKKEGKLIKTLRFEQEYKQIKDIQNLVKDFQERLPDLQKIVFNNMRVIVDNDISKSFWIQKGRNGDEDSILLIDPNVLELENIKNSFLPFGNDRSNNCGFIPFSSHNLSQDNIAAFLMNPSKYTNKLLPQLFTYTKLSTLKSIFRVIDPKFKYEFDNFFYRKGKETILILRGIRFEGIDLRDRSVIESLIIILFSYALQNNITIDEIDLSDNPSLTCLSFIDWIPNCFPWFKRINITNTSAPPDTNPYGIEIIKEDIFSNQGEPPLLVPLNEHSLKLSMFTPIKIKASQFPTNRFIAEFFSRSWQNINKIDTFYSIGAGFSVSVDHSVNSALCLYEQFTTNYITDQSSYVIGSAHCRALQSYIFPKGFFAYPTSISNQILYNGMYSVIVRGVFQGVKNYIFAFHRSFIIGETGDSFEILNDNLFLTNAKP